MVVLFLLPRSESPSMVVSFVFNTPLKKLFCKKVDVKNTDSTSLSTLELDELYRLYNLSFV